MNISIILIQKTIYSIGMTIGPALIALFIFDFKYASRGKFYYYTNGTEWGIAIGVLLVMLALVSRKWRH
ncbi:MAG: hypothetical protein ACC641_06665 [Acidiferrobacterales bacterium]